MPDTRTNPEPLDYAHSALIVLAFALFATDHLVHYPVALMALLGVGQMLAAPRSLAAPPARRLLLLFALIWLPMLVALNDAVDAEHSAKTVVAYLHFLPAGYYLMQACARPHVYRLVTDGVVVLLLFVGFDAFAQLIWRRDMFGYPYDGSLVMGVFYPKQRLGLFLGVFAPLILDVVRRWCHKFPALWLTLIPLAIVMVTSLKRSGWVMLVLGLLGYLLLRRAARSTSTAWLPTLTKASIVGAIVVAAAAYNPAVRNHIDKSLGLFSGDLATVDASSGYRISLWRTGWRMLGDNWLDGVGPRGYRVAYAEYAAADDFWIERNGRGQTHPHLMLLEVAVECGLIGMLGLLVFQILMLRYLVRARAGPYGRIWLLCAAVGWFPLNTHLAFYGSYWATLVWMLLAIGLARLQLRAPGERAPATGASASGAP